MSDHSVGFGGKFGVQKDRVDKSALGWEHHEKLQQHESQKGMTDAVIKILIEYQIFNFLMTDHSVGFGGKFGVQKDRVDKSAVGWEYHEKLQQHESQKGYKYISSKCKF